MRRSPSSARGSRAVRPPRAGRRGRGPASRPSSWSASASPTRWRGRAGRARSGGGDDVRDRRRTADPCRGRPAATCRPPTLQWVGRHSYALYLWHWPLKILAEAHTGPLSWPARIVIIGIAVALSVLSSGASRTPPPLPLAQPRCLPQPRSRRRDGARGLAAGLEPLGLGRRRAQQRCRGRGGTRARLRCHRGTATVAGARRADGGRGSTTAAMPAARSVPADRGSTESHAGDGLTPPAGSLDRLVASTQRLSPATPERSRSREPQPSLADRHETSRPYDDGLRQRRHPTR